MTNLLRISLYIILMFVVSTTFHSCKTEGCTDSLSENYDDNADENDGSCTYASSKFFGNYDGLEMCGGVSDFYEVAIYEASSVTSLVYSNLYSYDLTLTAEVDGDTFTFSHSYAGPTDGVEFLFAGTGTYVDENTITVAFTLDETFNGNTQSESCDLTLSRQE